MKHLFVALTILLCSAIASAQDTSSKALRSPQKRILFFTSPDPVEITLVSDFKKLKTKRQRKTFQPATVTVTLPNETPVTEDIQLSARGEFRRETCFMPPILLDFKNPKATKLNYLKKLKLVCGCALSSYDEELLLKEFLVYKIYNLLTEMSFNVRLAKMTYRDSQNKMKEYSHLGFLIEDVDDLAKRTGCREFTKPVRSGLATDNDQMALVSMFEYMIGNTDWSLPNRHNVRFIQSSKDSFSLPYVVPHDFDYSGLVDAPYAIPQPEFGIQKVTDRYYRGFARTKEQVQPLIQLFKEKKEFIISTIMGFDRLSEKVRKDMVAYINDFYKDLNDSHKAKYIFEQAVDHN